MDALRLDLRHALVQLLRRPGFSLAAVLSLALGIGGNAAIFAFADGFVFHPFAYPDADRLVTIGSTFPRMSERGAVHRGHLGARVPRHPRRPHPHLARRVRPRQPEHLGRRSGRRVCHGAGLHRPVRAVRPSTAAGPRLLRRRAGTGWSGGRGHQLSRLAGTVRRRRVDCRADHPGERVPDGCRRRDAAGAPGPGHGPVDSLGRRPSHDTPELPPADVDWPPGARHDARGRQQPSSRPSRPGRRRRTRRPSKSTKGGVSRRCPGRRR